PAHGGGLGRGPSTDGVRDVHLDGRELHLRDGGQERRIAGAERGRVEDRRVEPLIVRLVQPVDDLALDVRVEDLDLDAKLLGVAADALVVLGQRHRPKMSTDTLPRMFMPAPWITRTLGIALSVRTEWWVFYSMM